MSDKTEQPTQRRLRRARAEGSSGASAYAAHAVAFVAAVAVAPSAVGALVTHASGDVRAALGEAGRRGGWSLVAAHFDHVGLATGALALTLPILASAGLAGGVVHVVQTGGVLAGSRLAPRLDRIDPGAGLARLFSGARLFAVVRALVAGVALALLAYRELADRAIDFARTSGRVGWVGVLASQAGERLAWRAALLGLMLSVVDVLVVRRSWLKGLMMTKAEVRRDHRDAEGDPAVKAARERAYRELLAQSAIANVRRASVVVVNPTHLACALRYQTGEDEAPADEAPVVVASGEGELAARIVQAARAYGVPIVRDVPLARALVELQVGDAIPEILYEAVAEILRDVAEADRSE
jgi:flagellar biosynthesis protein FlhB